MKLDVLVSTMNNKSCSIMKNLNIRTNAIIIDQCDKDEFIIQKYDFGDINIYKTTERGLSKSRNMALRKSKADICLLCDDDEHLIEGYEKIIIDAFKKIPQADVIVFNIERVDNGEKYEGDFKKITKSPKFKTYCSVKIAFRREKIINENIKFNENFGSGSRKYSMGEDSLFIREINKKSLNVYTYPKTIAFLECGNSTWFKGYNEKYFYDIGAYLNISFPILKYLFIFYYPMKLLKFTEISFLSILKYILYGINGCKKNLSYDEYIEMRDSNDA